MKNKHVKRINLLLSILLGAGVFIFFGVYYSYHLHYQEQFQMFLFTSDYFVEQVSHPGGMADYLGGFLTQFYYYSWAGAAILTGAIGGIHRLMVWIANRLGRTPGMVSAYSATFFMFLYSVLRRKFSSFRSHLCGNGAGSTHRIYIY